MTNRTDMLKVNGVEQTGYKSYFMQTYTPRTFNEEHRGVASIYWRDSAANYDENVHLMGVDSVGECYSACLLSTDSVCWIFR